MTDPAAPTTTPKAADALLQQADALTRSGQWRQAAALIDAAAALQHAQGCPDDAARSLQLAATLHRLNGETAAARQRVQQALDLCGHTSATAVPLLAELGDIALAEHAPADAAPAFTQALDLARSTHAPAEVQTALLQRRALAQARAGRADAAIDDLEQALTLISALVSAPEPTPGTPHDHGATARQIRVALATACQDNGRPDRAETLIESTRPLAEAAADHAVLADLALLQAARALDRGDATAALALARQAREQALAGRAPAAYIGAVTAIAQLAETGGDRTTAYATLASGWATLTDLLGADLARQTFQPLLLAQRQRWGIGAFDTVRHDWETRRRQALQETPS